MNLSQTLTAPRPLSPAVGSLSPGVRLPLANCHRPAHPGVWKSQQERP
jgi:hypothetical protein